MGIIIYYILYVVLVIADPISTRTEVNLNQLHSKIVKGEPSIDEYKSMASLQLDEKHICSSGIFHKGYLATAGQCAWKIRRGMLGDYKATAVLGQSDLKKGQRVRILDVMYSTRFRITDERHRVTKMNLAVIMIEDNVDYTNLRIMSIPPDIRYYRFGGRDVMVCGWGAVTADDQISDGISHSKYTDNLHCMSVSLFSRRVCAHDIQVGNFKRYLLCGKGEYSDQITTPGDIGSPLMMTTHDTDSEQICMIGITINPYKSDNGTFLRFIRTDRMQMYIKNIKDTLELSKSNNMSTGSSTQPDLTTRQQKRPKLEESC